MKRKVLFVGGVAGSGKTTVCRRILELTQAHAVNIDRIACSLADCHGLTAADIEHTPIDHLESLQDLIAEEISQCIRLLPGDHLLVLDGHFVLPGIGRDTYRLPSRFFAKLEVNGVLVCAPSIDEIQFRIASDSKRTRVFKDSIALADHARAETEHAKAIAFERGVPLFSITCATELSCDLLRRSLGGTV